MTYVGPAAPLTTPRLRVDQPTLGDAPDFARLLNDFDVVRWLAVVPHPYTEADARAFISDYVPNNGVWRVAQQDNGATLGVVGLSPSRPGRLEIGYWIGRAYWGAGYATEAASAVVAAARADPRLAGLTSGYFDGNAASANVLRKLGFREIGRDVRRCEAQDADLPHVTLELPF